MNESGKCCAKKSSKSCNGFSCIGTLSSILPVLGKIVVLTGFFNVDKAAGLREGKPLNLKSEECRLGESEAR